MSGDFWSRRRAAVESEAREERKSDDKAVIAKEHAALEDQSDEEILAALDLPDPDTLKEGDDFSLFMAKAVPDRIRRRALRTLWKSNPVLANVDHLVEYGEDYTDSATVIENLQTAYQVGKGMMQHVEEMARQAAEENAPKEEPPEIEEETVDEAILAEADLPLDVETSPAVQENVAFEMDVPPTPRRMKFRIEETA